MYNLLRIYERVHGVKSTTAVELYKLWKKYNKNKRLFTVPPGGEIPKDIRIKKVEADSRKLDILQNNKTKK